MKNALLLASLMLPALSWAQCPPASPLPAPITENFSTAAPGLIGTAAGVNLPSCWTMFSGSSSTGFRWETEDASGTDENSTATGPHYDNTTYGVAGGMYVFLETSSGTAGNTALFVSPPIDLTGLTTQRLEFYYHMYGATTDSLKVQVLSGGVWTDVWGIFGQQQTLGTDPWNLAVVPLTSYTGTIQVRFRGRRGTSFTGDMGLDDIYIGNAPLCPQPFGLGVASTGSTTANIQWTAGDPTATAWEIEYGPIGFVQGAGTLVPATATATTLTSLTPGTQYSFYVREACVSVSGQSNWSGPFPFRTAYGIPYLHDFSDATSTQPGAVWNEADGNLQNPTVFTSTTASSWAEDGFGNNGFVDAYRITKFSSTTLYTEWILSPSIDLGTGQTLEVRFDAAVTAAGGTGPGLLGVDDTIALVISTNNGATWERSNIIGLLTNNDVIPNTGGTFVFPLTGYSGTVRFGLYAKSNASTSPTVDFFVDNFEVRVPPACPDPITLTGTNITGTTADINWVSGGNNFNIEYGPTGFQQGTGTVLTSGTNTIGLTGLSGNTTYDVYVQNNCGSGVLSPWAGPFTFTTAIVPYYLHNFSTATTTQPGTGWNEADGNLQNPTVFTSATASTWIQDGFANNGTTGAYRIQKFSSTTLYTEWIISPSIDLGSGNNYEVRFDAAVTATGGTGSGVLGADDTLALVISTDNGATWERNNIIGTLTNGNSITNTGTNFVFSLSGYNGVVKLGLYAKSNASTTPSVDLFVDNFEVRTPPACPDPTSLTASNITGTTADLNWFSTGSSFAIEYGPAGFGQGTGTTTTSGTNSVSVSGLTGNTTYDYYVRTLCGGGQQSPWAGPFSFTTAIVPYYLHDFSSATTTTPGTRWSEADGNLQNPTVFTSTSTSNWAQDGFGNVGTTGAYRITRFNSATLYTEWIISPPIDLGTGNNYEVRFEAAVTASGATGAGLWGADDSTIVVISTDNGATWSRSNILTMITQANAPGAQASTYSASLAGYNGVVRIGIYDKSNVATNPFSDFFVDNFEVRVPPACGDPTGLGTAGVFGYNANLTWTSTGTSFNVEYGPQGFAQGLGTLLTSTNDTLSIAGLTPVTCYDYYVQNNCGGGSTSTWSGPFTFCTTVSCPVPSNVAITPTAFTASINFVSNAPNTNYVWGLAGTTPTTGTVQSTNQNSISLTGLSAATVYTIWLQDSCGVGDVSTWAGPFNFATLCAPITAPYSTGFTGIAPGLIGLQPVPLTLSNCWEMGAGTSSTGFRWETEDASGTDENSTATGPFYDNTTPTTAGGMYVFLETSSGTAGNVAFFTSPEIVTTSLTNPQLSFYYHMYGATMDTLRVDVWSNGVWDRNAWSIFGQQQTSGGAPWSLATVSLASYGDTIRVRFAGRRGTSFTGDISLDDISVANPPACPSPQLLGVLGTTANTAGVYWTPGAMGASTWFVEYGPVGFAPGTGISGVTVNDTATLTGLTSSSSYQFYIRELCPNGVDTSNYVGPVNFNTQCVTATVPYTRDFDSWAPLCWDLTGGTQTVAQAASDYMEFNFWSWTSGNFALATTEPIALPASASQVEFRWSHLYSATYPNDQLILMVREAGTANWDTLKNLIGPSFTTPGATNTAPAPSANFIQEVIFVPSQFQGDTVQFRFVGNSGFGPDVYIDDFKVNPAAACPFPTALTATGITSNAATMSWTAGTPAATQWQVQYGPSGFVLGSGTLVSTSAATYNATGLNASTAYQFYAREVCVGGLDTSNWAGPFGFATLCGPVLAPYLATFTGVAPGLIGIQPTPLTLSNCWELGAGTSSTGFRWETEDASGTDENSTATGPFFDNTTPGVAGGMYVFLETSSGTAGNVAFMTSPEIITTPLSNPELSFYYHMYGATMDTLRVDVWSNGVWDNNAWSIFGQQQTSGTAAWNQATLSLASYGDTVRIRFAGRRGTSFTGDMSLDDIAVSNSTASSCAPPTGLSVTGVCDSAFVSWSGQATSLVQYGPTGFVPGTGTVVNALNGSAIVTGLTSGTSYDYWVADICPGTGDTTLYTGPFTFVQPSGPSASFTTTVNAGTVNFDASASIGAGQYSWNFGDGSSGTGMMTSHTYTATGSYTVTLTVTNSCGQTASVTQTVVIVSVSTCPQPSGLNAANVQCNQATLGWASLSGNSLIQWGPAGFTPGTGTVVNTISPYVLTGLNPGTAYDFWVADICSSNGDTSVYSGPVSFTTATAPLPFLNSINWTITAVTLNSVEVTFNTNAGPTGVTYLWDFGNGSSGNTANPVATYLQGGTYSVTVLITNACGSIDSTISIMVPVGLEEDALAAAVAVFPNPTSDRFSVVIDQGDAGDFRFTLTNALGQVLEVRDVEHRGGNSEVEFDLSAVAKGIYLLRIDNGKASVTRRIHKN